MPTISFTGAERINPDRDGMDVEFYYTVETEQQSSSIHVVGSTNSWNMSPQERGDYAQVLFTSAISYIERYWRAYKELPSALVEVIEGGDFPKPSGVMTDWRGYKLSILD